MGKSALYVFILYFHGLLEPIKLIESHWTKQCSGVSFRKNRQLICVIKFCETYRVSILFLIEVSIGHKVLAGVGYSSIKQFVCIMSLLAGIEPRALYSSSLRPSSFPSICGIPRLLCEYRSSRSILSVHTRQLSSSLFGHKT